MSYTYTAVLQYQDSDGRFANLTETPTVTAYDLAGNSISSPSITNLAPGVYKVAVTQTDLEDVVFRVVPHADDQAAFADIAVMQDKVYHVADIIDTNVDSILEDTGTTLPGTITTIDGIVDDILEDTGTTLPAAIAEVMAWTSANVSDSVTSGAITQIRGNTWDFDADDLTLDDTLIQFVIKNDANDQDDDAILMIDNVTGLLRVNGAAGTAGDASLAYAGTTLTVEVAASVTALLPAGVYHYGIQSIDGSGNVAETYGGTFTITADMVRATA